MGSWRSRETAQGAFSCRWGGSGPGNRREFGKDEMELVGKGFLSSASSTAGIPIGHGEQQAAGGTGEICFWI